MRFSATVLLSIVAVVAAADNPTTTTTASTAATTVAAAPVPTHTDVCTDKCGTDVTCQAQCRGNPYPNKDTVAKTNACVDDCKTKMGNATDAAANAAYSACSQNCINTIFITNNGQGTGPNSIGKGGSSSSGSSDNNSGSSNPSGTASSSAAGATTTAHSGAAIVSVSTSVVFGLILAAFAL